MTDIANGQVPKYEIDPSTPLSVHGLTIRRRAESGLEEFLGNLSELDGVAEVFDKSSVTVLKRTSTLGITAFDGVSREEAEAKIGERVRGLAEPMQGQMFGAGIMPFGEREGGLIIANFVREDEGVFRGEHAGILKALRLLVPHARIQLRKFNRIGIPVGKMVPEYTNAQKNSVYKTGDVLTSQAVTLSAAAFRPRLKQEDATKAT